MTNVKNGVEYGCHCDLEVGQRPDGCVLDYGEPSDCSLAQLPSGRQRRSKWTCYYWKPIRAADPHPVKEDA